VPGETFAVLPGVVVNRAPRIQPAAAFFEDGTPIAAICHGPWMETGHVRGRRITFRPALKSDCAKCRVERVDRNLIANPTTSRQSRVYRPAVGEDQATSQRLEKA
jgi:protease I